MTVKDFIFEGRDDSAFFVLYAGLRMYMEQKDLAPTPKDKFSIPAAEAYSMLQDLKKMFKKEFTAAELEYNEVYGKVEHIKFQHKDTNAPATTI